MCCATKRLVEIDCPPHCAHLAAARTHPPTAARRQQEADVALLMPSIQALTERQYQLFFLFQNVMAQVQPEGLARIVDLDAAESAAAVAATLETAARGVIYEQKPQSPNARRMAEALQTLLTQIREQGATVYDREAAIALRAIEEGARTVGQGKAGDKTSYLELMGRLLAVSRAKSSSPPPRESPIVLP